MAAKSKSTKTELSTEERHKLFGESVVGRVNRAVASIISIGKLRASKRYHYSEAEVKKISDYLENEIRLMRERLTNALKGGAEREEQKFSL